jgi:hypothetical protein
MLANVAAKCFDIAEDTNHAGQATTETAMDFCKAAVM